MPIENGSTIKHSDLSILENISLIFNEFRFKRYCRQLSRFQEIVGYVPLEIGGFPEPAGTPENPLNKEELFSQLSNTLIQNGYTLEDIDKLRLVYEFADKRFMETPGKEKRKSGDAFITHGLWMANFLALNGITDLEVQSATILHDTYENTPTTLEEIKNFTIKTPV